MLDVNFVRENPDVVKKVLKERGLEGDAPLVDEFLKKDSEWRALKKKVDDLRHERNVLSLKVNELLKQGRKDEAQKVIGDAKKLPRELARREEKAAALRKELDQLLLRFPNIPHSSVPRGESEADNVEVRRWGTPEKPGFDLKAHGALAEGLGVAEFEKAAVVSGAGFHYLLGDLARINLALCQYAMDYMIGKGFKLVIPPLMMRRAPYQGVTDLDAFENMLYKVEGEDLYLIATSEHPLAALKQGELFKEEELPLCLTGFSPCFRKEIGSHGVDTKGLFRTHQFWKVEQFVFCKPEESWGWHEKLISFSEEIIRGLELPYRVVNLCTADLSFVSAKTYDVEVWMPRQQAYREVGSCSNCLDFQARRLNIRYHSRGEAKLVHTLNNTALATSRVMVAILENYQQPDGTVLVPKALQKYLNGLKAIKPSND